MANPRILAALERDYTRLLGEYEAAEEAIEPIVGLAAIAEADREITARKADLKSRMARISLRIRVEFDAMWTHHHLTPLRPRVRPRYGQTKAAYKALKMAKAPRTAHELAEEIAPQFGLRPSDGRLIAKLASAITVSFKQLLADGQIDSDGGKPIKWTAHVRAWRPAAAPSCAASVPLVRVASRPGAAKPAASPNTQPVPRRGAERSPARARSGTADRC